MKSFLHIIISCFLLISCKSTQIKTLITSKKHTNNVVLDLVSIDRDKVKVSFSPAKITSSTTIFHIPKIIPGTYSNDNYGEFIRNLKVFKENGEEISTKKLDDNRWEIKEANTINKITYEVSDTYDTENRHDVFSPAGSNILKNTNFILNLHAFVGYINETKNNPYSLSIIHPKKLTASSSQKKSPDINLVSVTNETHELDTFYYNRYSEVTDTPIMYSNQDSVSFNVNGIDVLLSVYSPNKIHTAKSLLPSMNKMMSAQKAFMGSINSTKKYSILLYLSTSKEKDATGFGALEHNNSTVVVLPESMSLPALSKVMTDVVSHEFFHIITPLTVHSEEIHDFNYNNPKMSQHLWMYEGTTEYFAQLFQIKQGLINEIEFFNRITTKIEHSKSYNDRMSFTEMSKNILQEPYKQNYNNVYEKGALISMCIDIIIREKSNGEKGILDLMKSLSNRYGPKRPFIDKKLIDVITALTYPEVGQFLNTHVVKGIPINYNVFFNRVGLEYNFYKQKPNFFSNGENSYISSNKEKNEIYFNSNCSNSDFLNSLKIQANDILVSINGKKFDLNNASLIFEISKFWNKGDVIILTIKRNGLKITSKTSIKEPARSTKKTLIALPNKKLTKKQLTIKNAWIKKSSH